AAEGDNDTERREFLKRLSGTLGATIAAGELGTSLALLADQTDEPDLDRLRLRTFAYSRQVHTDTPRDLLLLLHAHLNSLQGVLSDRPGPPITRELQCLASETATVAGYVSYRLHSYGDAEAYLARADKLAVEAGDGPLRAMALVARSALYSPVPYGGFGGDPTT